MAYSKKIVVLLFVFVILFSNVCFGFDETGTSKVTTTEQYQQDGYTYTIQHDAQFQTLYQLQYEQQKQLISRIYGNFNNQAYKALAYKIFDEARSFGKDGKFMLIYQYPSGYDFNVFFSYKSLVSVDFVGELQYSDSQTAYQNVPCLGGTYWSVASINKDGYVSTNSVQLHISSVPYAMTRVFAPEWLDLFKDYGFYIPESSDQSDITAIRSNTEKTQQELNNINSNITDDNVNVDSSSLPSDNTNDITANGFNTLFDKIYTTFTSGTAQDVVIKIPFTNKSFTINVANVYGGANLGIVKTLIQTFWYFVISYFIVQDIAKKINKIKSGDIEHVQEDNIKEDLL